MNISIKRLEPDASKPKACSRWKIKHTKAACFAEWTYLEMREVIAGSTEVQLLNWSAAVYIELLHAL